MLPLPLEKQVTALEISKRLKELGVDKESLFYWTDCFKNIEIQMKGGMKPEGTFYLCSAFTVSELGEMLKEDHCAIYWSGSCWYGNDDDNIIEADTEADARGLRLIYLLENNLIKKER